MPTKLACPSCRVAAAPVANRLATPAKPAESAAAKPAADPSVKLFDTGKAALAPLSGEAMAEAGRLEQGAGRHDRPRLCRRCRA